MYEPSELTNPDILLASVGSFWGGYYGGQSLVTSLLAARARLTQQSDISFSELLESVSRLTISPLRSVRYYALKLLESERNQATVVYGDAGDYGDGRVYGGPDTTGQRWRLPEGLSRTAAIQNRIQDASTVLVEGIDYDMADGVLSLRDDPFDGRFQIIEQLQGDAVVDRQVVLWLFMSDWQHHDVYRQFGYALGVRSSTQARYRDMVNAVYDCAVQGTSRRALLAAFQAACDIPLAQGDETVEAIFDDALYQWIVTDRQTYRCHLDATPLVTVGDALHPDQSLTDALQYHEFTDGETPAWLDYVAAGPGMAGVAFRADLIFDNRASLTTVTEPTDDYTEFRFTIEGWPADVDTFWAAVHARGVADGTTLAMRMDLRPEPVGQPGAAALPSTLNPLEFLVQNVLRNNAAALRIQVDLTGPDAVGLTQLAAVLHQIVPPATLLVLLTAVSIPDETVGPDDVDEELETGYGNILEETVDAYMVDDDLTIRQDMGLCL